MSAHPIPASPPAPAVTARWEAFLGQIRERFLVLIQEAQAGCAELLEHAGMDPVPMGNAWGAIEGRVKQLETKIDDTWSEQVEAAFDAADVPPAWIQHERAKGDATRDWIEVERERVRISIFAGAGRRFFQVAASDLGRAFVCSRCGAPLEVPFTFRAVNVACRHCATVNGFEPGTSMRMAELYVHQLCEEAAWSQWLAMHQAERAVHAARPVQIQHLKTYERAQLAYWHAYLTTRAHLLPDTATAFHDDLRGKMRYFYEQMDRDGVWVRAGRPADLR